MIYTKNLILKKKTIADLSIEDIYIEDIAYALSNITRFCGQLPFYSVAKHSIEVAKLLPKQLRLAGLLHDASEAYIGDVITPVKINLPDYKILEKQIMTIIDEKYNVCTEHPLVKIADKLCFEAEEKKLVNLSRKSVFRTENQVEVYKEFLEKFYDYN
jgi:hypothetical protein